MHQLRVSGTGSTLHLDLNEDLQLPRDAEVALKMAAIEYSPSEWISSNVADPCVQFELSGQQRHVILPRSHRYTAGDVAALQTDLTRSMNASVGFTAAGIFDPEATEVGGEFRVSTATQKTVVEYGQGRLFDPSDDPIFRSADVARNAGGRITRTSPPAYDSQALVYYDQPISRGAGVVRCRLSNYSGTAGQPGGFILGVSENAAVVSRNEVVGLFVDSDLSIALWTKGALQKFAGLNAQYLGANNAGNDSFEIVLNGPVIRLLLYRRGQPAATQLAAFQNTLGQDVYPAFFLFGDAGLDQVRATVSPYNTPPVSEASSPLDARPPRQSTTEFNVTVEFLSESMAQFLGFGQQLVLKQLTSNYVVSFTSPHQAGQDLTDETLIVVCPTFDLQSFDSRLKKRYPILAVAANPQTASGRLVHEISNPLFLAIRNQPMAVRRLTFQLLREDLTAFPSNGQATLVVVIRSGSHRD